MTRWPTVALAAWVVFGVAVSITAQSPSRGPDVLVVQNGVQTRMADLQTTALRRDPFELRFVLGNYGARTFHAARVAASTTTHVHEIDTPAHIETIEFFGPGTGMAPDTMRGYASLVLSESAHHYVIYDPNDSRAQRAELLSTLSAGRNLLSWRIESLTGERTVPLAETTVPRLYLSFLYDADLDGVASGEELTRFILTFDGEDDVEDTTALASPEVRHAVSGGHWSSGARAGTHRVLVLTSGWEHPVSEVYLQWLEVDEAFASWTVAHSEALATINRSRQWVVGPPHVSLIPECTVFEFTATHSFTRQERTFRICAIEPGVYTLR